MKDLYFVDCNCSIGKRGIIYPGSFHSAEDLEKRMKQYGISKSFVYHSMACEYNPNIGNRLLMEQIEKRQSLDPVWVVLPHHTGEFSKPDKLAAEMKDEGIKAVRIFPAVSYHNYSLAQWNCGELLSMLEYYRVPLMIGMEQLGWNELYDLCTTHPEMRVILTGVNYRIDRNIYSLLEKLEHLYIETSGYKVHQGIEKICSRFGPGRLLFGSGMPFHSGGAAVGMITYADINDTEKQMIASKNLLSLLEGVLL